MIEAIGGLLFLSVVGAILYKMTSKKETLAQAVNETVQEVKTAEAKVEAAATEAKAEVAAIEAKVEAAVAEVKTEVAAVEAKVEAVVKKVRKPRKKKGE